MPKMAPPAIPDGMIELMKQLSKSVLKEKPDHIYEYAAKYFEQLLIDRDGCLDKGYGKFRSYSEYCKFMKKMESKRPMKIRYHVQDESDSGIGSSNTDEESKNLSRKPQKAPPPDMKINGTAIQAATRKTKPIPQPRKAKNYSVNPKFKQQGNVERDKKTRSVVSTTAKENSENKKDISTAGKPKPKQRKLSSNRPSDCLIAITEETSVDVAEDNSDASKVKKSAAVIQRAFRAYLAIKAVKVLADQVQPETQLENTGLSQDSAAVTIQNWFKNIVQRKKNSVPEIVVAAVEGLVEVEEQLIVPTKAKPRHVESSENPACEVESASEVKSNENEVSMSEADTVSKQNYEGELLESAANLELQENLEDVVEQNPDETEITQSHETEIIEANESGVEMSNVSDDVECVNVSESEPNEETGKVADDKINNSANGSDAKDQFEIIQSTDSTNGSNDKIIFEKQNETDLNPRQSTMEIGDSMNDDIVSTEIVTEDSETLSLSHSCDIKETVQDFLENERLKHSIETEIRSVNGHSLDVNIENLDIAPDSLEIEKMLEDLPPVPVDELMDDTNIINESKLEQNLEVMQDGNVEEDENNKDFLEGVHIDNQSSDDNLAKKTNEDASNVEQETYNTDEVQPGIVDVEPMALDEVIAEKLIQSLDENNSFMEAQITTGKQAILDSSWDTINLADNQPDDTFSIIVTDSKQKEPSESDTHKFAEILEECVTDDDIKALACSNNGSRIKIHELETESETIDAVNENVAMPEDVATKSNEMDTQFEEILNETMNEDVKALSAENTEISVTDNPNTQTVDADQTINELQSDSENFETKPVNYVNPLEPDLSVAEMVVKTEAESVPPDTIYHIDISDVDATNANRNNETTSVQFCGTSENPEHCPKDSEDKMEAETLTLPTKTDEDGGSQEITDQTDIADSNANEIEVKDIRNNSKSVTNSNAHELKPTAPFLEEIATADETAAAINIQKSYRGYRARREINKNMYSKPVDPSVESEFIAVTSESNKLIPISPVTLEVRRSSDDGLGDIIAENDGIKSTMNNMLLVPPLLNRSIKPIEEVSETSDLSDRELDQIEEFECDTIRENQTLSSVNTDQDNVEQNATIEEPENIQEDNNVIENIAPEDSNETDKLTNSHKTSLRSQLSSDLSETEDISAEKFRESGIDETSRDERDDLSELENFDFSSCGEDSLEAMYYSLRKNEILLDKMHRQAAEQRCSILEKPTEEAAEAEEMMKEVMEINQMLTEKIAEAEKSLSPVGTNGEKLTIENNGQDQTVCDDVTVIHRADADLMVEHDSATDTSDIIVNGIESEEPSSLADESITAELNTNRSTTDLQKVNDDDFPKLLDDLIGPSDSEGVFEDYREYSPLSTSGGKIVDTYESDLTAKEIDLSTEKTKAFQQIVAFPELLSDDQTDSIAGEHNDKIEEKSENEATSDAVVNTDSTNDFLMRFQPLNQNTFPKLLSDDKTDEAISDQGETMEQKVKVLVSSSASISSESDENMRTEVDDSSSMNEIDITNPIAFAMKQQEKFLNVMHGSSYRSAQSADDDNAASEELDEFPDYPSEHQHLENIRRNILASSVSEADSDYMAPSVTSKRLIKDDFNISTAFDHITSTDSDSTIISAATKIQAGARGFLTRRRLRRSSAGTSVSADRHCSFGNAAIDKSLEDLLEQQELNNLDEAAVKIQRSYRNYLSRKNRPTAEPERSETIYHSDDSGTHPADDQYGITEIKLAQKKVERVDSTSTVDNDNGDSDEHVNVSPDEREYYKNIYVSDANSQPNDAHRRQEIVNGTENECQEKSHHLSIMNFDELDTAQRRMTLHRGDAVQRHSTPEEIELQLQQQNNTNGGKATGTDNKAHTENVNDDKDRVISTEFEERIKSTENDTDENTVQSPATIMAEERKTVHRKLGPRQRSMPVQIDTEFIRLIPKHLRKRVKSAGSTKYKI